MSQSMYIIDLETNLAHDQIWCCGVKKLGDKKGTLVFSKNELLSLVPTSSTVIGHNLISFDLPVLEKVWGVKYTNVIDTLVMARLYKPDAKGGHSLKNWGTILNCAKMDFDVTDFDSGYTEEMGTYCLRDLDVTERVHEALSQQFKAKGIPTYCYELEAAVRELTDVQENNGFKLDIDLAQGWYDDMSNRMEEITAELQRVFPPIITIRFSEKTGKRLKDHVEEFNVGSRPQIAKRLKELGAVFTEFTETGREKIDENTLANIDLPEAQLCAEYLGLVKISGMVSSWLDNVAEDGRIHGRVNTCGAATARMTHSSPNLAQIPSLEKARQCFTVEENNVLVGCDASGLELRCLAHYINDAAYTHEIIEGDVHTANQIAAGLPTRNDAKTFIYAFIYGAGSEKIGQIIGGGAEEGAAMKAKFLKANPKLDKLIKTVQKEAEDYGYVRAIDGRIIWVDESYKALNRLLQSCGALIMKVAVRRMTEDLAAKRIPYKLVAQVHDEFQLEVPEHFATAVGRAARRAIIEAGQELNMNCPLDGEYKIGNNWSMTH
mgnify:CR=1 FL=1